MGALTYRVIGKPSKYQPVVETFKRLKINQALEVSNGADPSVVRSTVYNLLKKNGVENVTSVIQNGTAVFWKG